MQSHLDSLDIKILEALGVYGPRNKSEIARRLDSPRTTVLKRINRIKSLFSLHLQASVYHTFIGLKKAFVFARATPGYEQLLWECMKVNGYWLYLTARYDTPESFYAIYGIPFNYTEKFEHLVEQIEKLRIAQNINLFWSTSIQTVSPTDRWYDHKSESWVFRWNEWTGNIESQGTALPPTLMESEDYPQKADYIDIIILKELEKNAECKICDIATLLDVPPQVVQYHLNEHVLGKGLIEGYAVVLQHFEADSDFYCFRFDFQDVKNMAKFALSLVNKPFVQSIGKIFGKDALFVHIYLPRMEFRGFTDSLSRLIRKHFMESYDYVIEDSSRKQQQTISYESFKDRTWIYNHEKHIEKLQELAARKT